MVSEIILDLSTKHAWFETMCLQCLDKVDDLHVIILLETLRRKVNYLAAFASLVISSGNRFILVLRHQFGSLIFIQ